MKCLKTIGFCSLALVLTCGLGMAWDLNGLLREWEVGPELRPYDIATLPDGSAWATHEDLAGVTGQVFTINPADGTPIIFTAPFDARFHTIDPAPDGTLWIADANDRIVHFDPLSGTFTGHGLPGTIFALPAAPYGVTVAGDGKVWFSCWEDPSIGVFDPITDAWLRFPLPSGGSYPPGVPVEIDFGAGGMVYFTIKELLPGGNPGFGSLDPGTGDFDLWTDPTLFFPDIVPLPPTVKLRTPWGIAVTHTAPDFLWFSDKTGNYLIHAEIVPSPLITRESTPAGEIEDAHFFAVDPDGVFWLASFGTDRIGTYDPFPHAFSSIPLETGQKPMGISISPIGEVWWAEAGNVLTGEGKGMGRFIPFTDSDGDGIDDAIDTEPAVFSNEFDDGATMGTISDRGDQELTVTEATAPHGVRIMAGCEGGEDPALITACSPILHRITVSACDDLLVTCGSATVQVLVGPVEVELADGTTVSIASGAKVSITEMEGGAFAIQNWVKPLAAPVTVEYQGAAETLAPGQSIRVAVSGMDIKPGSCPNPLNVKSKGVLPIAVTGTADFDVTLIDVATLELSAEGSEGIPPLRWRYEDVATPFNGTLCGCHKMRADGFMDLTLKFQTQDVVEALGNVNDGDEIILVLSGNLLDGTSFLSADCVKILKKGGKRNGRQ